MTEENPITVQYYNLVVYTPESDSTKQRQFLHYKCEGNLQIGNDGAIRCEKCHAQQSALSWYLINDIYLAEAPLEAKQLNFPTVASLAGQIASTAGPGWLSQLLNKIEE